MSQLWSADDFVASMGGRPVGKLPSGVDGISIDTRSLQPGDAFFAIKGEKMDGHDFATAAVKAGAGLLVVAEGKLAALGRLTAPMVVVPDVLVALEKLGAAARARSQAKVVAITGSAGKTSTKEALRLALAPSGKVHASDKSFNNHWGVPLTLARLPEDAEFAIFEIGMNHENEIRPLVKLVRPHVAVVTLIAAAHLGHFASLDDIARAKAEIFEGIEPGGTALVNRDDPRWKLLADAAKAAGVTDIAGFGAHGRARYRLLTADLEGERSRISARIGGKTVDAVIGAPGRHIVQNALAVLACVDLAGADLDKACAALANLVPERGRGKRHALRHPKGTITLIDESYNANPASMRAAIAVLDATPVGEGGRRIAVLGDMLELGAHAEKLHSALGAALAATRTDMVLLAGREMKALADALPEGLAHEYRAGVDDLRPVLLDAVRPGDAVMIKSSNGIGFSRLVDALIDRFPAGDAGKSVAS